MVSAHIKRKVKNMNSLGENIKNARKHAGMTQHELAKATNLSRSYIGDIEKDRYNPILSSLKAIASATDTPLEELISGYKYDLSNGELVKIPKDLNRFLQQTEIVFNGDTYNLTEEERAMIMKSLEVAFYAAKKANKK